MANDWEIRYLYELEMFMYVKLRGCTKVGILIFRQNVEKVQWNWETFWMKIKIFDWNESVRIEMKSSAEIKNELKSLNENKSTVENKSAAENKSFIAWNEKFLAEMKVRLKLKCVNET